MNPVLIVLPILTVLMFDLGLTLAPGDFKAFARRPAPVIAGLAGQLVILPLIAFALCLIFRPDPVIFTGIMLIACSPGGSSSNIFSKIAGGDVALSVSLTAMTSIITVFTIPFIIDFSIRFAGFSTDAPLDIPASRLLMQNIVLMLLPIILASPSGNGSLSRYQDRQGAVQSGIPLPHAACRHILHPALPRDTRQHRQDRTDAPAAYPRGNAGREVCCPGP